MKHLIHPNGSLIYSWEEDSFIHNHLLHLITWSYKLPLSAFDIIEGEEEREEIKLNTNEK